MLSIISTKIIAIYYKAQNIKIAFYGKKLKELKIINDYRSNIIYIIFVMADEVNL